jgi:hypothetical protein
MSVIVTWNELAIISLLLAYLLAVLVYMLSHLISSDVLRAWAKHEIQTALLTVLLFSTLFALTSVDIVKQNLTDSRTYLETLYHDAVYCQTNLIRSSSFWSTLSSLSFNLNPHMFSFKTKSGDTVQSQGDNPASKAAETTTSSSEAKMPSSAYSAGISLAPFLQPILTSFTDLQSYFFIPYTMLKLHNLLITFVALFGATLMLPLGVALRAFKFTRHGGNLLIALFVALYFVLPPMYLFSKGLMVETMGLDPNDIKVCDADPAPSMLNEFIVPFLQRFGMSGTPFDNDYVPTSPHGGDVNVEEMQSGGALSLGKQIISTDIGYDTGSDLAKIFLRVGMESMLLPTFAIIITLGLAREFAQVLGSDIDFSQLVRVV